MCRLATWILSPLRAPPRPRSSHHRQGDSEPRPRGPSSKESSPEPELIRSTSSRPNRSMAARITALTPAELVTSRATTKRSSDDPGTEAPAPVSVRWRRQRDWGDDQLGPGHGAPPTTDVTMSRDSANSVVATSHGRRTAPRPSGSFRNVCRSTPISRRLVQVPRGSRHAPGPPTPHPTGTPPSTTWRPLMCTAPGRCPVAGPRRRRRVL